MNPDMLLKMFNERDYNGCLALIKKLPSTDLDPGVIKIKAYSLQRTQQYEAAMEAWSSLISSDPKEAEYYAERGVCKFHLRFKSTLEDFNTAIELDDENPYRYACRAYILDKLGDTIGAIKDYQHALHLDPENEVNHNNLGLLEEKMGYNQNAQLRFKQADLLSELRQEVEQKDPLHDVSDNPAPNTSIFQELRKMVSSGNEFRKFCREALAILKRSKD